MKDMLQFLIARDTMHQNQWLAVIEELGGHQGALRSRTATRRARSTGGSATPSSTRAWGATRPPIEGRFTHGRSLDGKGEFTIENAARSATCRSWHDRARGGADAADDRRRRRRRQGEARGHPAAPNERAARRGRRPARRPRRSR
jgi:Mn-containing catalase